MQVITISYLLLCAICLFLILKGLRQGLNKSQLDVSSRSNIWKGASIGIMVWLILISVLANQGFFSDFSTMPPKITLVLIPPMIFWLIMTIRSKNLKLVLMRIPPQWIIYLQSFRVIVELILWKQFLEGLTPVQMTFEGRNFDVLVGLTAPIIGYLYAKKGESFRKVAIAWNIAGMALLVNILVIAILSFPTKFRYFMNEPANTLVAEFPVVLLPGFLVMIAYCMHFFSLKQLLARKGA